MIRFVQYLTTASTAIEVDVPDDTPELDVDERARQLAEDRWQKVSDVSLCHHCASKMDLGDFVQDEDEGGVYGP